MGFTYNDAGIRTSKTVNGVATNYQIIDNDKSGDVWVPDNGMDGGPGWRVHIPDGSHGHVYPNGKVRSHAITWDFASQGSSFSDNISEITGLTGTALIIYLIVSEGSRVIPARNLIPVP